MEKIFINGGNPLRGDVTISGAKNAVVAILPATILAQDVCVIENVPDISDVSMMIRILHQLGARVRNIDKTTVENGGTAVATIKGTMYGAYVTAGTYYKYQIQFDVNGTTQYFYYILNVIPKV